MKKSRIFYFQDNFIKDGLGHLAAEITQDELLKTPEQFKNSTIIMRGITKYEWIPLIKVLNSNFIYIDTGYLGNLNYYHNNVSRRKIFHRVVLNELQHTVFPKKVSEARYLKTLQYIEQEFGVKEEEFLKPWKKNGGKILLCPPSIKMAAVIGMNLKKWINKTIKEIKKYSDREIVVRYKQKSRRLRGGGEKDSLNISGTIQSALDNDIFLLATYNSIAATEAVIHGIPALVLGDNAAAPVSINKIKNIENPKYPDRQTWLNQLTCNQFHSEEFVDGTVWEHINKII